MLVAEPRRVAVRAAAARMASLLGEKVGERVGYAIRGERHTGPRTRDRGGDDRAAGRPPAARPGARRGRRRRPRRVPRARARHRPRAGLRRRRPGPAPRSAPARDLGDRRPTTCPPPSPAPSSPLPTRCTPSRPSGARRRARCRRPGGCGWSRPCSTTWPRWSRRAVAAAPRRRAGVPARTPGDRRRRPAPSVEASGTPPRCCPLHGGQDAARQDAVLAGGGAPVRGRSPPRRARHGHRRDQPDGARGADRRRRRALPPAMDRPRPRPRRPGHRARLAGLGHPARRAARAGRRRARVPVLVRGRARPPRPPRRPRGGAGRPHRLRAQLARWGTPDGAGLALLDRRPRRRSRRPGRCCGASTSPTPAGRSPPRGPVVERRESTRGWGGRCSTAPTPWARRRPPRSWRCSPRTCPVTPTTSTSGCGRPGRRTTRGGGRR